MDLPYSQQQQARRKNRSAANLQHLTLAPLTPRLPLRDDYDGADIIENHSYFATAAAHGSSSRNGDDIVRIPSYIHGRSAPTTPRLLSKSPTLSRSHSHEGGRRAHFASPGGSRTPGGTGSGSKGHASALAKSLSTTHLPRAGEGARQHRRRKTDNVDHEGGGDDWLFRAAVLVTSEARESKGQSWLTARASSTSLTGLRSAEEADDVAAFERELAREREYLERISGSSRRHSRRGSLEYDVTSPLAGPLRTGANAASRSASRINSRANSRLGSRANSRAGSRIQLFTHVDAARRHSLDYSGINVSSEPVSATGGYFDYSDLAEEDETDRGLMTPAGPDFVNLDEKLEAIEFHQKDTVLQDEDQIRRLVKREKAGGVMGSWLGSVFGWSLFSVQETESESETEDDAEDGDEDDDDEEDDEQGDEEGDEEETDITESGAGPDGQTDATGTAGGKRRRSRRRRVAVGWNQQGPAWATCRRRFEGDDGNAAEDSVPPPPRADEGTWQDAAWLLSVASKVLL